MSTEPISNEAIDTLKAKILLLMNTMAAIGTKRTDATVVSEATNIVNTKVEKVSSF